MPTTELTVHVDKDQLDKLAKDRIAELEHKLKLAEQREKKAKAKVAEYESLLEENNLAMTEFTSLFRELLEKEPFNTIAEERFDYGGYA